MFGTSTAVTILHPTPAHLTERALLVSLNIREWGARRRDRDVTDHVAREHGADPKIGCYTKALVPKRFLAKIASIRNEARHLHHQLTLPWGDDGYRILPVDLHLQYMDSFRALRSRFEQAVSDFLEAYEEAKAAARGSLGSLFHEDDYPSPSQLRRSFALEVRPQPLPTGYDWRIDLPTDAVARIREELTDRLEDAHRQGLSELHRRLAGVVSRMAETLALPEKIFRDSLVGNVRQLCDLLPALNITQDPGLDSLNREIRNRLASLEPDVLRFDPQRRQAAAVDAAALLTTITDRLASYTGAL